MKVRLDFCDFHPGFSKTNNFFYNILKKRFDVEICDNPDFLIFSDLKQHVHRVHNCVKIFFCVEDFKPDFQEYDYAFTCHELEDDRNLRLPYYFPINPQLLIRKDDEKPEQILATKTKFCCFLTGYANNKTRVRNEFFNKLCRYKKVDSGGRALNNMGTQVAPGAPAKHEFLRPYKFNIAFENHSLPGYTTEKIVEAMLARCVPLYWGNPEIAREFNPRSFINYYDFPNEDAMIEKIIELDQDDAKYLEYLRQPYFHNNLPNEYYSHDRLLNQFEKIFTTPITPVSHRRYRFQIGRRFFAIKNRPAPLETFRTKTELRPK